MSHFYFNYNKNPRSLGANEDMWVTWSKSKLRLQPETPKKERRSDKDAERIANRSPRTFRAIVSALRIVGNDLPTLANADRVGRGELGKGLTDPRPEQLLDRGAALMAGGMGLRDFGTQLLSEPGWRSGVDLGFQLLVQFIQLVEPRRSTPCATCGAPRGESRRPCRQAPTRIRLLLGRHPRQRRRICPVIRAKASS